MGGDVEGHETMEELLTGFVVAEQRVPVDVVELAVGGRRTPGRYPGNDTNVKAKQLVEPPLYWVVIGVTNRDRERYLFQHTT